MAGQSAASTSASKGPALIPLGHHTGKPPIPLHRPVTVIGSRSNARIHLTSSTVSKAHALVVKDGPNVYIRDLASRTHVYVNGDQVREHILENGDLIKIGSFTFKFKAGQTLEDPSDRPAPAPPAKLDVTGAEYPVPIDERVLLIGRRQSCDVHLLEDSCSTAHAVIFEMNGHRHVRDLGSRTGTYVNGVAVHQHQLNPGDHLRIGETTLTYTPSAELAVAEPEAAAGSVLDLEVIDDLAKTGELEVASTSPASAENAPEPPPLSEAYENLSPDELTADTASRSDVSTSEVEAVEPDAKPVVAEEAEDLSPRRGWRPAAGVPVEEVADEALTSTAPAVAQPTAPQQQDDDLLRFAPTTSDTDETSTDQGAGAAVLDVEEPAITAGQFTDSGDATDSSGAGDDLLELAAEEIEEREQPSKPLQIDLSDSARLRAAQEREPQRIPSMDALDFSTLRGDAATPDVIDPIDVIADEPATIEPSEPAASTQTPAPAMRFDREEPKAPSDPIAPAETSQIDEEIPVDEAKPKRGRKSKKPKEPTTEKVAASRTRRKLKEAPVAEQQSVEEPADEPLALAEPTAAQSSDEVISATEPTPESALDLDGATTSAGATFDEAAIDQVLGEQTVSDPLTDTGVTRAVRDLTGEAGEIVEATPEEREVVADPVAELRPPAPAPPSPVAKQPGAPSYKWGANQENFLGGVPVALPPVDPNSRRPVAPIAPIAPIARPPREAAPVAPIDEPIQATEAPSIDLLSERSHRDTGQQVDEVNALIDEILAPASSDGEPTATEDDLLAPPPTNESRDTAGESRVHEQTPALPLDDAELLKDAPPPPMPLPMPDEPGIAARLVDRNAGPAQSRPVIPIPPPPPRGHRPARRERGERAGQVVASGLRQDELIPPYAGAAAATMGRVTTKFDGLAMPPVREADVFSQMSPPATTTAEDPFGGATGAASPSALTPMDMVQADEAPPRLRRAPISGRAPVARDLMFGNAPGAPAAAGAAAIAPPANASVEAPAGPIEEQLAGGSRRRALVRPAIPGTIGRTSEAAKSTTDEFAPDAVPAHSGAATRRAAVVMGEEDLEAAHRQRRRRTRWLTTLVIAGLLVWGGALAGIYYLFVPSSLTQVAVKFRNYDFLSTTEGRQLQEEQQKLLNLEATRIAARRFLHQSDPEIPNGFLDNVEQYLGTANRATWPENRKGVLLLSHRGVNDPGDRARVAAMAQALYSQNEKRINDAKRAEQQLRDLKDAIARDEQAKTQLSQEIEQLRIQGDSAPDTKAINQIRDEVAQLEKAWGDALAAVKSREAELKRLKEEAAPVDPKNNAVAPTPAGNKPAPDDTLTAMETQLAELTSKLNAAQNAKKQQAEAARKALDQTLQGFEQQLGTAKQLMKDSPELSAYVTAAQRLQETTRVVIDDIIRRQEQQYGRLNELKQTLTEKMEQRRSEQLSGDPQLKELNERLATATRQLNAAKNSGMKREADDKGEEVKLLTNMIKAREEMLPKDATMKDFADTIAQIQTIIDTVQSNVESDRKRADQLLLDAQQNFAANAAVEKLPEAQKSVAADLEQRMAAINAARQQYNQAISATAVDDDEATKQLRQQATAIQTAMDTRKKELADAAAARNMSPEQQKARQDMIPVKEKELTDLQKTEANARLAYTNREKDYRDAQASAKAARDSLDRLTELQAKQDTLDKKLAQAQAQVPLKEDQAKRAVTPEQVSEADVLVSSDSDKRGIYGGFASLGIAVVFAGLILFALHSTSGGMPAPAGMSTASIGQISKAHVADDHNKISRTNGDARSNGDGNGQHDADEDSEPAPI